MAKADGGRRFQTPQFRADTCLTELEQQGFTPAEVRVILLHGDGKAPRRGLFGWIARGGIFGDTMDQADGISVMDGMVVGASIGALWGIVWGSRLPWGPVTVGFLGLLTGGVAGLVVDRLIPEQRRGLYQTSRSKGAILFEITAEDEERLRVAQELVKRNAADQMAWISRPSPNDAIPRGPGAAPQATASHSPANSGIH